MTRASKLVRLAGMVMTALLLGACNGNSDQLPAPPSPLPTTFTIGGNVSGLVGTVVLANNGSNNLTLAANGVFAFSTALASGAAYSVTVAMQPAGQTCSANNAGGTTVAADVTNIAITCVTVSVTTNIDGNGGTVTGPDGVQVVIPPGALGASTAISIKRSSAGAPAVSAEFPVSGFMYEFTPHDIVFDKPVTIRLPVAGAASDPKVLMARVGEDWNLTDALVSGGFASFERNTFSWGYGSWSGCSYNLSNPDLATGACINPQGYVSVAATPAALIPTAISTPLVPSAGSFTLNQAATLRFTLNFVLPAQCTAITTKFTRNKFNGNTPGMTNTIFAVVPSLTTSGATPFARATGSSTFDLAMTEADNGKNWFAGVVSCTDSSGIMHAYGDSIVVTASISQSIGVIYPASQTFAVGRTIAAVNPIVTGTISGYGVSPALPVGLVFNTTTGQISGTPTTATPRATYTVTAQSGGTTVTFGLSIAVVVPGALNLEFLAGAAGVVGNSNGTGVNAQFSSAFGIATDSAGNTYVTDTGNKLIRKITPDGVVSTLAGSLGSSGSVDGTGGAATFSGLRTIAVDSHGNLFVTDYPTLNYGTNTANAIRKITPAGVVTTLAGSLTQGGNVNGTGGAARFLKPAALAIDAQDNLYVLDLDNAAIRKITPAGVVTTVPTTLVVDGGNTSVAVDGNGVLYVGDEFRRVVWKIAADGTATVLAGALGQPSATVDGVGGAARFDGTASVIVESPTSLLLVEFGKHIVRRVKTADGAVTTVMGASGQGASVVFGSNPLLKFPSSIAMRNDGNVVMFTDGTVAVATIP
jgi:hypothetical protein